MQCLFLNFLAFFMSAFSKCMTKFTHKTSIHISCKTNLVFQNISQQDLILTWLLTKLNKVPKTKTSFIWHHWHHDVINTLSMNNNRTKSLFVFCYRFYFSFLSSKSCSFVQCYFYPLIRFYFKFKTSNFSKCSLMKAFTEKRDLYLPS